jgi:hypothetical protein
MRENDQIAEHLVQQFESIWKMISQSIENVPNDRWSEGIEQIDTPWTESKGKNIWYFSERVYHIIQTIEFYSYDSPDSMKWGSRIGGIQWRKESPEVTASRIRKDDMKDYLEEIKEQLENKLRTFSDMAFYDTDGFSEWQTSRLAKFLYTMRHSMWHIGELGKMLRDCDCKRINWT